MTPRPSPPGRRSPPPSGGHFCITAGRRWLWGALAVALYAGGNPFPAGAEEPRWSDELAASHAEVTFNTAAEDGVYRIPHVFIFTASETVNAGGVPWVHGVDYRLEYDAGVLTILRPSPYPLPITVSYDYLPFLQTGEFRDALTGESPAEALERIEEGAAVGSSLEISGSKTFSVSAGSDGATSFDQSLRLSLHGAVGDVKVTGEISDQSLPMENGGATEDIEAVDKISVRVEGRHWAGTFGDYDLVTPSYRFASFERRLTGLEAEAFYPDWECRAYGARARGRYASNEFYGADGVQGPYRLSARGDTDIVVLPGTEKIWYNGALLKPGENNDYVVDYDLAQVIFTVRRPISAQDRIVVDFQYSTDEYRRDTFGADALWRSRGDALTVGTLYVQEEDNRFRDLFGLTRGEKEKLLPLVGDDAERARVVARDAEGNVVYDYVGPSLGSYVREWNAARGRYVYEYVGPGNGDYNPRTILLPLPARKGLLDVNAAFNPARLVTVAAEGATSEADLNTFSPLGDEDNTGLAGALSTIVRLDALPPLSAAGQLELKCAAETRDERFQGMGREDDVSFLADWDLEDDVVGLTKPPRQKLYELTVLEKPASWLEAWGTYGEISHSYAGISAEGYAHQRGERWSAGGALGGGRWPHLTYKYNAVNRGGQRGLAPNDNEDQVGYNLLTHDVNRRREQTGTVDWGVWKLRPFARVYEKTRLADYGTDAVLDAGTSDEELEVGSGLHPGGGWDFRYGHTFLRGAKVSRHYLAPYYAGDVDAFTGAYDIPALLNASLEYTRSAKDYVDDDVADTQSDLTFLEVFYTPLKQSLSLRTRYELTGIRDSEREEYFEVAADGDGDYRREPDPRHPGRYVYIYDPQDPNALYLKKYRATGRTFQTLRPDATLQLDARPYRLNDAMGAGADRSPWLDAAAASFYLHGRNNSVSADRPAVAFLQRLWDDDALETALERRVTLQLLPINRTLTFTGRWSRKDDLDRTVASRQVRGRRVSRYSEVLAEPVSRLTTQGDVESIRETKTMEEENIARPEITLASEMVYGFTPTVELTDALELKIRGETSDRRETTNDLPTRIRGWKAKPELTLRFVGTGVANVWYERTLYVADGYLGSETLFTHVPGVNQKWEASVDKGVGQYVIVILTYDGEKAADDAAIIHRGRLDVNIYF